MTTVLHLSTSIHSTHATSAELGAHIVEKLQPARVIHRDLALDPVPHLDAETFAAFRVPAAERSPRQAELVALSDRLIAELKAADTLVIGLPMYNFGVPSTLKAWFDHVARAGVTFRYTADGPQGLLTGKRAVVVATRGGRYAGTASDTQEPFVRQFLAFLGITEVEFVFAEGLALGAEVRDQAIATARERLGRLDATTRLAA